MDLFSTDIKKQKLDMPNAEVYFYPNFFNKEKADFYYKSLLATINWQQDYIKFYGKKVPIPRLEAWYGDTDKTYTYSGIQLRGNQWTNELLEIKEKIEEESQVVFTNVLINQYRTGKDSVSWHADDEKELGKNPIIASISLGSSRVFQFKHKENPKLKVKITLTHGSFLLMQGETQHHWLHQIPKTQKNISPRINLTFRILSDSFFGVN